MNSTADNTTRNGIDLRMLGWDDFFASAAAGEPELIPGRVTLQQKKRYHVMTAAGELDTVTAGRLRYRAQSSADFPVVGDWVLVRPLSDGSGVIERLLPRKSKIARDSGTRTGRRQATEEQVLAANVDTVFLVAALNEELNLRRIDRYLAMIAAAGARPILILNKADLCPNAEAIVDKIKSAHRDLPVLIVSALRGIGLEKLQGCLRPGETTALLGSSGVGKTTIINALTDGDRRVMETAEYKDHGRHATTHRELVILQDGSLLIDNPGLRSVQLGDEEAAAKAFPDIEELAASCRFRDCRHLQEPGCAVLAALVDGRLDVQRYESYVRLQETTVSRKRPTKKSSKKRRYDPLPPDHEE